MNDRLRATADVWLSRTVKFIIVVGGVGASLAFANRVMSNVDKIASLDTRITTIEQSQPALLYMVCTLFQDTHSTSLPAVCDQAISRGPR